MDLIYYRNSIKDTSPRYNINLLRSHLSKEELIMAEEKLKKIAYILTLLITIIHSDIFDRKTPYMKDIVTEINDTTGEYISKKDLYRLIHKFDKKKELLKKFIIKEQLDKKLYLEQNGGSFINKVFGWYDDTGTITKVLDVVSFILDIAGFIPGVGIGIDAVNTVILLVRQKYIDALFSAINIIPLVGSFIGTPGKYITKFVRYSKRAEKMYDAVGYITPPSEEPTGQY